MEELEETQRRSVLEVAKDLSHLLFERFPSGVLASHGEHTFSTNEQPLVEASVEA